MVADRRDAPPAKIRGVLRLAGRSAAVLAAVLLPAGVARAQAVTFDSDWEKGITGPGRFLQVQRKAPDRFARSRDDPRAGAYSAHVTVRPGDKVLGAERSEALVMTRPDGSRLDESAATSGTQFYAISVRLAPGWKNPIGRLDGPAPTCTADYGFNAVLQLHGPDAYAGAEPAFALQTWDPADKRPRFTIGLDAGVLGSATKGTKATLRPSKGRLSIGSWVDWIFQVRWAEDRTGFVNAWRRDEGETAFRRVLAQAGVATLQRKAKGGGLPHYWKTGFYRPDGCSTTNELWIEGPARGTSMDAVRTALWGR